jgi:predicted ATPase
VSGDEGHALGRALQLTWRQRVTDGFFLRAETFHQFSSHLIDLESTFARDGGRSLHEQSHGEAFLSLFENRFEDGLYLLDESEAALSPQRQLAFMQILHSLAKQGIAQFIIATHSPMLLCLPGARVLELENGKVTEVSYRDTEHYRLARDFLNDPDRYLRHLLANDAS